MKQSDWVKIVLLASLVSFFSCENKATSPEEEIGITIFPIAENITQNTTWQTGKVYIIENSIKIDSATLIIEPEARIEFKYKTNLVVGAGSGIIARGLVNQPIRFTSHDQRPEKGFWEYLEIADSANNAAVEFYNCIFENGGGTWVKPGMLVISKGSAAKVSNCVFLNSNTYGIYVEEGGQFYKCEHNTIFNCDHAPVCISARQAHTVGPGNYSRNKQCCIRLTGATLNEENVSWRKLDVPYLLSESIQIKGVTLTIEPGTEIQLSKDVNVKIEDNGALVAAGTLNDMITFTSLKKLNAPGYWEGLIFTNSNWLQSELSHCIFEYGGGSTAYPGMIYLAKGENVDIYNNLFQYSGQYAIYLAPGNSVEKQTEYLSTNTFVGNLAGEVFLGN